METNKISTKLKTRLNSIYKLSQLGVGGEKSNAEFLLSYLLKKHNVSIEELLEDKRYKRYYRFTNIDNRKLIAQIVFSVINSDEVYESNKHIAADVTDCEHIEIAEKIDFHLNLFKKEKKQHNDSFLKAYVLKHKIFSNIEYDNDQKESKMSDEEYMRILSIINTLGDESYIKKIEQ